MDLSSQSPVLFWGGGYRSQLVRDRWGTSAPRGLPSLPPQDPLFKGEVRHWSSTELAVVLSIVFTVSAYGITKLELKQHAEDKAKAIELAKAEWEAKGRV